jgi:iron complex transport system ATP-binding protein
MEHNNCINIKEVSIGFKKNKENLHLFNSINLNFFNGDFVGVVGLNGIGKSTFLKSICGLLPLLSGEVFIDQKLLGKYDNNELAKKISIVLTEKINGFNLSVYDLVASGQMPYTNSFNNLKPENKLIINEAIKTCGLYAHQHKLLHELSDGLFQKTLIAKSIAQQTNIMLLDEPSAFLDFASKHDLFSLLKNQTLHHNKCILVSSHDLDLILKYCNKILLLTDNKVELIPTSTAISNPIFKQLSGDFL